MGGDLVMADLGSATKCADDDAPILPRSSLPGTIERLLDKAVRGERGTSRPDAIIITQGTNPTILVIEFKYCKETSTFLSL